MAAKREKGPPRPEPGVLVLLGTVHGDPAGYRRAWRFFEHLWPEILAVEISPFSVRYRRRAGGLWQRRLKEVLARLPPEVGQSLAVARVAAQLELPFEYRVARDWGRAHGVPVNLVDTGAVARRHLPRYHTELLTPANLSFLGEQGETGTLEGFVAREFRRARLALEGGLLLGPDLADPETQRRERLMARRLARLAATGKRVVHLGGWEHLVPGPQGGGLLRHLKLFQPRIFLLEEADFL